VVGVPKPWQLAPGRQTRVLCRVARIGLVAKDRPSRPEKAIESRLDERLEGCNIAVRRALDERRVERAWHRLDAGDHRRGQFGGRSLTLDMMRAGCGRFM